MNKLLLVIGLFLCVCSSCKKEKKLVDANDYIAFLQPGLSAKKLQQIKNDMLFWQQRLLRDTGNYVDMLELARGHLHLFKITGEVSHLRTGDSLLARSSVKLRDTDPDILFALSQTAITQHRFSQASYFNEAANKASGSNYIHHLLAFDAAMEQGQYYAARKKLESLADKSSFDYLIRKSKIEDHRGNLDKAIHLVEQAYKKVKDKNSSLECWAMANLGDMYGHAGRISDAYETYLKVLQKDSSYLYALKGIAWIAYSHDGNTAEAKRILHHILSQSHMPDLWLILAEMEEWEGNEAMKNEYIARFIAAVEQPAYGAMYNKYLIQLYTDEFKDYEKALQLAQKEVAERPTPETYDWLSWVYYNMGEKEKAFDLCRNYVYQQTHEPDAAFHTALILGGNGKTKEAKQLLKECYESSFELGPVMTKLVKEKMNLFQ